VVLLLLLVWPEREVGHRVDHGRDHAVDVRGRGLWRARAVGAAHALGVPGDGGVRRRGPARRCGCGVAADDGVLVHHGGAGRVRSTGRSCWGFPIDAAVAGQTGGSGAEGVEGRGKSGLSDAGMVWRSTVLVV
jgi:hypothetical protein